MLLRQLFGDILDRALDLIDRDQIKLYIPISKNSHLLEVCARNGVVYKFFHNINYCPCETYRYSVVITQTASTCKHVLAAKLADILDRYKVEIISEDAFKYLSEEVLRQDINRNQLADVP